jgi:hypothetical protein
MSSSPSVSWSSVPWRLRRPAKTRLQSEEGFCSQSMALARMAARTAPASGLRRLWSCRLSSRAATPETRALAALVPLWAATPPPGMAPRICSPGARMPWVR